MFFCPLLLAANCYAQPQQKAEKWEQGVLIWSRGTRLEALQEGQKRPIVLRANFGLASQWDMSADGRKLTFAAEPGDVDFFNAGAHREYLLTLAFNGRAKVFLAGYGPKAVDGESYDYQTPSYDASGKKIVVSEGEIGQFMDDSSGRWPAIYDLQTRKRLFVPGQIFIKLAPGETKEALGKVRYEFPSLAPNGQDLVCLAKPDDGDSIANDLKPGEKAPPTLLVHFDLARKTAEVLASIDDQLSVGRIYKEGHMTRGEFAKRYWNPQFSWHPTQKKLLFTGPVAPTNAALNLFVFDLKTHQTLHLTNGNYLDKSPQWTLDGKSILWLRNTSLAPETGSTQLFRAAADGKNARAILPQVRGASQIQIVAKIADWTRYRKLPVEALAGKDK